jgi:hypothetical protein
MDLKDFIAIKGKADLYRILAKTPKGIIVETLNDTKTRFKVEPNLSVLLLYDITIFSNDNTDLFLRDIFKNTFKKDGAKVPVSYKDDTYKLKDYFREIAPNYDEEKVYISDIKKIIKWYTILVGWYPEVIENIEKEEEADKVSGDSEESTDKKIAVHGKTKEEKKTTLAKPKNQLSSTAAKSRASKSTVKTPQAKKSSAK